MGIPDGFGSILISGLISAMLYGITILQTYVYYMHCSEDALIIKFLVAATSILDTLHVSFMCHMLYHYLITNYGVSTSLDHIVWSFPASVQMNVLAISVVQSFFAHKVHYLYRREVRWLVTAPTMLFMLAHLGFGTGIVILMFVNDQMSIVTQTWYYGVTPAAAAIALADILITVSLCVLLYDNGSRSTFPRTKRLLNTLIIYAVNRCLLTSLVAIGVLTANVDQQPAWTMGMDFILGKLYPNSLLASLNTRQYIRSQGSGPESDACINAVHFAGLSRILGDSRSSEEEGGRLDLREVDVLDITTEPAFEKPTTLRREAGV